MEKIRLIAFAFLFTICCSLAFTQPSEPQPGANQDGASAATVEPSPAIDAAAPSKASPAPAKKDEVQPKPSSSRSVTSDNKPKTPSKYLITFDTQGGNKIYPIEVDAGKTIKLPNNPEKNGYNFLGWFTDDDVEFTEKTRIDDNKNVIAHWDVQRFTVTFNTNGGNDIESIQVRYNETVGKLPDMPVKEGYKFDCWIENNKEFTENTRIERDVIVYAKWTSLFKIFNERIEELNTMMIKLETQINFQFILLGISVLLLVLIIVSILLVSNSKAKKIRSLKETVENNTHDIEQLQHNVDKKPLNSFLSIPQRDNTSSSETKEQINSLSSRQRNFERELDQIKEKVDSLSSLNSDLQITKNIASGALDPLDVFNKWAGNPSSDLPKAFYYIEGDIKIRTKHSIKESFTETKWITNREGMKKYLFPNPCSFNQMTDISTLYEMDQAKLKGKGQNKIKVVKPCEMIEAGFIEFKGELEIL
ncbi:hypothetical protein AGMMS49944_01060 [Spirochaetia bacterium]|nr:hypothetical protein AGMMS49944_01060 [Spirochaetia bacterium]